MTEEINNLNTDFKELFSENKLEELVERLDNTDDAIVTEITVYNYEIIKKYYDSEKYNLILQFIRFVAFTSFLWEYSAKRGLLEDTLNNDMSTLFHNIYELVKNNNSNT